MEWKSTQPLNTVARCVAFGVLLIAVSSFAQTQEPPEIESRFNLNTFKQTSTALDGYRLEHGEVLQSFKFGFDALVQVDDDPLTWQSEVDGEYRETDTVVERFIVMHLGGAVGLFDYGQLAVQMPFIFDRGTINSRGGLGDLRFIPKAAQRFQLSGLEVGLAFLIPFTFPTGDAARFLGEGVFSLAPGLAADVLMGKLRLGLNFAYRWREEEFKDFLRGSVLRLAFGAEYYLMRAPGELRAIVEIEAETQTEDFFSRDGTPLCVLGGLRYRFGNGIGAGGAVGAGLTPGIGAPDFRFLFGGDFVFGQFAAPKREATQAEQEDADPDRDGIPNEEDGCPDEPEDFDSFGDADGCPDLDNDGDGVEDGQDECPLDAENVNGVDDDDGCPETDRDGDLIPDDRDQCAEQAEDRDGFVDQDGCPDEDNDLDNMLDAEDQCPNLPESPNDFNDEDGCPDFLTQSGQRLEFTRPVRFVKKTAELHETAYPIIDELTGVIIANPSWAEIQVTVHTSGRGSDEAMQRLSEDRARTIVRLLIHGGVIPERLIGVGRGNADPLSSPDTKEGRRKNERVEVEIITIQEEASP